MKAIKIGNRFVGGEYPCFIILELGVNFRNMQEAKKLVDTAIEIGADAVKFQTFHAKNLVVEKSVLHDGRGVIDQYQEALSSEDRLTDEFQTDLIKYAQGRGIITFSTPSHFKDVDLLNRIGNIPAFKFGSDDLTNIPLLKYAAKFGKPMFISSGVSNLSDIDEAIRAIKAEGNEQLLLFHCVSRYPAKPEDMNLRVIQTLQNTFGLPIGLSDHTEGTCVSIAAVALGVKMIEKHFTLGRSAEGPDNFFSMEPQQMRQIIAGIREVESAMGSPFKRILEVEESMIVNFHKSVYAIADIESGERISQNNVDVLRPMKGIPAKYLYTLYEMTPKRKILKGEALRWEDFK